MQRRTKSFFYFIGLGITLAYPVFSSTEIQISSTLLEKTIRETIHKPTGKLNDQDLLKINNLNSLSPADWGIIQYCKNLESLSTLCQSPKAQTLNLSVLSNLAKLKNLRIESFQINDLTPISTLVNLETLDLRQCIFPDLLPNDFLSSISKLQKLKQLDLSATKIQNIGFCEGLGSLEKLNFDEERIFDLSPLKNCKNLTFLSVSKNQIRNLDVVSNLKNLKQLVLDNNSIIDATPLLAAFDSLPDADEKSDPKDWPVINLTNNPLNAHSLNIVIPSLERKGIWVSPSCWNWLKPLADESLSVKIESKILTKFLSFWEDRKYFENVQKNIVELLSDPKNGYQSGLSLAKKLDQALNGPKNQEVKPEPLIQDMSIVSGTGKTLNMLEERDCRLLPYWDIKESCLFIYLNDKVKIISNTDIVQIKSVGKSEIIIDVKNTTSGGGFVDKQDRWLLNTNDTNLKKIASITLSTYAIHAGPFYEVAKIEDLSDHDMLGDLVVYAHDKVTVFSGDPEDPDKDLVDSPYLIRDVYRFDEKQCIYTLLRSDKVKDYQDYSKSEAPKDLWKPSPTPIPTITYILPNGSVSIP